MALVVRKPNLDDLNEEGIPRDFVDLQEYWNYGVRSQEGMFKFIPRRTEISVDEVRNLFVPAIKNGRSVNMVAELDGKVVGTITVIYDVAATEYEHRAQRTSGAIGESVDPRIGDYCEVLGRLYEGLEAELREIGKKALAVFPVEDKRSLEVLTSLGRRGREIDHGPYHAVGLSGKGIEFEIG
ncbi:MAG: hypothetical protein KJ600_00100 [Nanoarchaeota archaeon]|nr:hypothetical protein [Nanoarchaeota archaeon]MBU1102947.1 hypothetical protein [Nanoarchaeota archaeon]